MITFFLSNLDLIGVKNVKIKFGDYKVQFEIKNFSKLRNYFDQFDNGNFTFK